MNWSWDYVAQYVIEQTPGGYVNWECGYFICPHCGAQIDRSIYPHIEMMEVCPICHTQIEEEDE